MADRSLRGMRLGAQSLQSEEGVSFAQRVNHTYRCTVCGRDTVMTFAADAEAPESLGVQDLRCRSHASWWTRSRSSGRPLG